MQIPMLPKEQTKYRLAQAMKVCMKEKPVDRITVQEIVDVCGVTRQTFYRKFLDKYDLINWYFDKLLLESFAHMGSGRTILEGLERKFAYIQEERVFFTAAFSSDDQNCLKKTRLFSDSAVLFPADSGENRPGPRGGYPIFIGNVLPWLHLYDSKVGAWRNAPDPRPNGPRAGGRYAREARGSLPSVAPFARNISLISLLF